jgi:Fe-S cluster assembly protein SufD
MSTLQEQLARIDANAGAGLPPWAGALRARDQERFAAFGLPHRRLEDWKYTPLDRLAASLAAEGAEDRSPLAALDGALRLDLEGGALVDVPAALPDGVRVLGLSEALDAGDATWRTLVEELDTDHPARAMAALNTADLGHGLVIRVEDGVDAGIVQLTWRGVPGDGRLLGNARVLVVLGDGARLDLVESFTGGGALNLVNQLRLGAGSRLRHARLQDNAPGSWLITRTELEQGADSAFEQASLDLGAGLARHDLRARLAHSGSRCDTLGAYLPTGDAHVDHHLDVRHEAPGCHSEQTFRGVLHDRGRAVFNGRVHVLPGADDSEAHQSNQNLLLSREAEVNTKPELIIEADEVVASHGATVGQLDETAVFYLRSRGVPERRARHMLTGAFCRSVVDAIGNEAARDAFQARLEAALEAQA